MLSPENAINIDENNEARDKSSEIPHHEEDNNERLS